jgi:hypothetical protein
MYETLIQYLERLRRLYKKSCWNTIRGRGCKHTDGQCPSILITKLELDLISVTEWMKINRLSLNLSKTVFMIVASPSQLSQLNHIKLQINEYEIKRVTELKFLGVIFDEKLSWTPQTKKVVSSCNRALFSLRPFSYVLSLANKSILVNALVLSHIKYSSVVWLKSSSCNYKSIDSVIRRGARFVYSLMKFDSVSDLICTDLNWLFCKYQYKLDVLKLAYKSINNIGPLYFKNYLCTNIVDTTRTRHRVYQTPALDIYTVGRNSFKYTGSKELIDLPNNISMSQSFFSFKNDVIDFLLAVQFADHNSGSDDSSCCDLSCIDDVIASLS